VPLPLIGRRPSPCERVAPMLPAFAAREADLDGAVADHVGHCLRCQAEVARYRRMLRTLRSLRADTAPAPPEILSRLLDDVDEPPGAAPLAVAVLVSAAAVLGAAAALAWTRRSVLVVGPSGPRPSR
jgi:anti-sigma factor RsiW